jgi:hypothetical protein
MDDCNMGVLTNGVAREGMASSLIPVRRALRRRKLDLYARRSSQTLVLSRRSRRWRTPTIREAVEIWRESSESVEPACRETVCRTPADAGASSNALVTRRNFSTGMTAITPSERVLAHTKSVIVSTGALTFSACVKSR